MISLEDLRKTTGREVMFWLVFSGSLISPGLLIIWRYFPALIKDCNPFMLVLLSIAATFPLIIFNFLMISSVGSGMEFEGKFDDAYGDAIGRSIIPSVGFGSFAASISLGGAFLISYFWNLSLQGLIKLTLFFEVGFAAGLFSVLVYRIASMRKKKRMERKSSPHPSTNPSL